eukprot:g1975.t1
MGSTCGRKSKSIPSHSEHKELLISTSQSQKDFDHIIQEWGTMDIDTIQQLSNLFRKTSGFHDSFQTERLTPVKKEINLHIEECKLKEKHIIVFERYLRCYCKHDKLKQTLQLSEFIEAVSGLIKINQTYNPGIKDVSTRRLCKRENIITDRIDKPIENNEFIAPDVERVPLKKFEISAATALQLRSNSNDYELLCIPNINAALVKAKVRSVGKKSKRSGSDILIHSTAHHLWRIYSDEKYKVRMQSSAKTMLEKKMRKDEERRMLQVESKT